jgi:hypothetical protein
MTVTTDNLDALIDDLNALKGHLAEPSRAGWAAMRTLFESYQERAKKVIGEALRDLRAGI